MFTLFDIIIFIIISTSTILGIYGGFIKLIINLLGFVSSIVVAYLLYPYSLDITSEYCHNEVVAQLIAGIVAYIISLLVCTFLTSKLLKIVSCIRGGLIDRLFGLLAGLIRGTVISVLLFFLTSVFVSSSYLKAETLEDVIKNTTINKYPDWFKRSCTEPYLDNISKNIVQLLPEHVLKLVKLPKEPETINITNVLEKAHHDTKMTNDHVISEDLKTELGEILPKEAKH